MEKKMENETETVLCRGLQGGGFPKLRVPTFLGVPSNKDYIVLGFILGCPCFGKLPYLRLYETTRGTHISTVHGPLVSVILTVPCRLKPYTLDLEPH